MMNIVVISGSTRVERASHQVATEIFNRASKRENVIVSLVDAKDFNLPNLDYVYKKHPAPSDRLNQLSNMLTKSDGIIVVSPEHNESYSGALKNMLDYFGIEFNKKVMGAVAVSSGRLGGVQAAVALQKLFLVLGGISLPHYLITPEVQNIFKDGVLVDESYGKRIEKFLDEFIWLTEAIKNHK